MIKKEWLHNVWVLLFLLILGTIFAGFPVYLLAAFIDFLRENGTVIFLIAIGITSLLIGVFYWIIFGKGLAHKLRMSSALSFVILLLVATIPFLGGEVTFNLIIISLVIALIVFAEIYFLLEFGAISIKYLMTKDWCCKTGKSKLKRLDAKPKKSKKKK